MLLGFLTVLSLDNLKIIKIHKTKAVKTICIYTRKILLRLTFIILG